MPKAARMPLGINANKPQLWKADIAASVDQFNQWFLEFAPEVFKKNRAIATEHVKAVADDIVRAARKWDQLMHVADYLNARGYREHLYSSDQVRANGEPGTYKLDAHVPLVMGTHSTVAIDVVIQRKRRDVAQMPLLLDVKSSPSFAAANKHHGESAEKLKWLRMTYGNSIPFVLMLGGHFDAGYLGVQAAEGVDWVWEHRVDDVEGLGV